MNGSNRAVIEINVEGFLQSIFEDVSEFWLFSEYFQNLKELEGWFDNCETSQIVWTSPSQSKFRLTKNPSSITLSMKQKEIDARSLQKLFVSLPKLEKFAFQVNCNIFNDNVLEIFISKTLPSLKNLKDFQLFIEDSVVTDLSVKKLLNTFPQEWFLTLENLQISFKNTKITNESLREFVDEKLIKFNALKNFELNTTSTCVTLVMRDNISQWEQRFKKPSQLIQSKDYP